MNLELLDFVFVLLALQLNFLLQSNLASKLAGLVFLSEKAMDIKFSVYLINYTFIFRLELNVLNLGALKFLNKSNQRGHIA